MKSRLAFLYIIFHGCVKFWCVWLRQNPDLLVASNSNTSVCLIEVGRATQDIVLMMQGRLCCHLLPKIDPVAPNPDMLVATNPAPWFASLRSAESRVLIVHSINAGLVTKSGSNSEGCDAERDTQVSGF